MDTLTVREQIVETVHRLFIYTDSMDWKKLQDEVFTDSVLFDMSSLGNEAKVTSAKSICETWESGFAGLTAVNHLTGNLLISVNDEQADVFAYATATHYKSSATQGKTREFIGTYDLHVIHTDKGWRIDQFKYNLKFMNGNLELN